MSTRTCCTRSLANAFCLGLKRRIVAATWSPKRVSSSNSSHLFLFILCCSTSKHFGSESLTSSLRECHLLVGGWASVDSGEEREGPGEKESCRLKIILLKGIMMEIQHMPLLPIFFITFLFNNFCTYLMDLCWLSSSGSEVSTVGTGYPIIQTAVFH